MGSGISIVDIFITGEIQRADVWSILLPVSPKHVTAGACDGNCLNVWNSDADENCLNVWKYDVDGNCLNVWNYDADEFF